MDVTVEWPPEGMAFTRDAEKQEFPIYCKYRCLRCNRVWGSNKPGRPRYCGKCKTAAWDTPKPERPRDPKQPRVW